MNKKRLLKLADFLETVPRRAFNIDSWQSGTPDKPEGDRPGECGFAGCAVGWAVHQKMFRGLHFGDTNKRVPESSVFPGDAQNSYDIYFSEKGAAQKEGYDAAAHVFGLDGYDTRFLFSPNEYSDNPTPKQVAKRIRKFVAD